MGSSGTEYGWVRIVAPGGMVVRMYVQRERPRVGLPDERVGPKALEAGGREGGDEQQLRHQPLPSRQIPATAIAGEDGQERDERDEIAARRERARDEEQERHRKREQPAARAERSRAEGEAEADEREQRRDRSRGVEQQQRSVARRARQIPEVVDGAIDDDLPVRADVAQRRGGLDAG